MDRGMENVLVQNASTPAEYAKAYRNLSEVRFAKSLKVALLISYTAEILKPYIAVELAKVGFNSELFFGPFNHFEQEILQPNSAFYHFQPVVTILHPRLGGHPPRYYF